jgi:hypothetical protein
MLENGILPANTDNQVYIIKQIQGTAFPDAIVCQSDLTTSKQIILKKLPEHQLVIEGSGLTPGKSYTVKLLARSRYRGNRVGAWREIKAADNYGYKDMVERAK